jgi:pathogenesis-related protein 1
MPRTFWSTVAAGAVAAASFSFVSSGSAQEILTLQNAKRSRHCAPPLTWSSSLAAAAQTWANGCSLSHSAPGSRPNQGENLAWGSGSFSAAASAVNS